MNILILIASVAILFTYSFANVSYSNKVNIDIYNSRVGKIVCSGGMLTENYALTNAHCIYRTNPDIIIYRGNHYKFTIVRVDLYNDLILLKLNQKIDFNVNVSVLPPLFENISYFKGNCINKQGSGRIAIPIGHYYSGEYGYKKIYFTLGRSCVGDSGSLLYSARGDIIGVVTLVMGYPTEQLDKGQMTFFIGVTDASKVIEFLGE